MSGFIIRPAKEHDCENIMQLIKELGEFERRPHDVKITADDLKKDGFGENPKFHCYVAEQTTSDGGGEIGDLIAYIVYTYAFSAFTGRYCIVDHLYIKHPWREKGVGRALSLPVIKAALANGCVRMQCTALDWNKPALQFYKILGAKNVSVTEGKHLFRLPKSAMEKFVVQSRL